MNDAVVGTGLWWLNGSLGAPLTAWHPEDRSVTLHYLLSTHRPYQVMLMRSRFKLPA